MSMNNVLTRAAQLTDRDLAGRLRELAGRERQATAELVAHLAAFDERRLYLPLGHGSLFSYCTAVLHLAEHAAFHRIEAARLARRFPVVLDRLAEGGVNLTTLRLIGPHLTDENHVALLDRARGRSKREMVILVAALRPQPDVPASIRRLPDRAPGLVHLESHRPSLPASEADVPVAFGGVPASPGAEKAPARQPADALGLDADSPGERSLVACPVGAVLPAAPSVVAPLAPGRFRVQLTVDQETHDALRRLQDLMRREIPDGDPAVIVGRALRTLLREVERNKTAAVARPRPTAVVPAAPAGPSAAVTHAAVTHAPVTSAAVTIPPTATITRRSRDVPDEIVRAVWARDESRCAFVALDGTCCAESAYLEIHHLEPYAIGGEPTLRNLALRCRPHNRYEAERDFGPWTRPGASPNAPGAGPGHRLRAHGRRGRGGRLITLARAGNQPIGP